MSIDPTTIAGWKAEFGRDPEIAAVIDQALAPELPMPGVTTALGGKLNGLQRTRLGEILAQIRDQRGTDSG